MAITVRYSPVKGVAQLAQRSGQAQQAVREQAYAEQEERDARLNQYQQGLLDMQQQFQWASQQQAQQAQQRRDQLLNQFQGQRDVRLAEFDQQSQLRGFEQQEKMTNMAAQLQAERDIRLEQFSKEAQKALYAQQEKMTLLQEKLDRETRAWQMAYQQQQQQVAYQHEMNIAQLNYEVQKERDYYQQAWQEAEQERQYDYQKRLLRLEYRKREDLMEAEAELKFDYQKQSAQWEYDQRLAREQFDFQLQQELERQKALARQQLEDQKFAQDTMEQWRQQQQQQAEMKAKLDAIDNDPFTDARQKEQMKLQIQTGETVPQNYSNEALSLSQQLGISPQVAQQSLDYRESLPNKDLQYGYTNALTQGGDYANAFAQQLSNYYQQQLQPQPTQEQKFQQGLQQGAVQRDVQWQQRQQQQAQEQQATLNRAIQVETTGQPEWYKQSLWKQAGIDKPSDQKRISDLQKQINSLDDKRLKLEENRGNRFRLEPDGDLSYWNRRYRDWKPVGKNKQQQQSYDNLIKKEQDFAEQALRLRDKISKIAGTQQAQAAPQQPAPQQQGGDRVTVRSPNGQIGTIPKSRLKIYQDNGYTLVK